MSSLPSPSLRRLAAGALILCPLAFSACPEPTDIDTGPGLGPACGDDFRYSIESLQIRHQNDVDILFVIDNSASMAEAQVKLNAGVGPLFAALDAADVNYRVGFTTTDNGNPWCLAEQTTPESGKLVLSSCETRLGDFVADSGNLDVRDLACNEQCVLDSEALAITPTLATAAGYGGDTATPRPWLERSVGVTNLPASTDPIEAFKCFAPQGINGCGFESPLESMYLALIRAQNVDEVSYGFLRPDAVLAVVLLSDEVDCSYNEDWASIFEVDGDKAFWSDPDASFPSSAVCWAAGVSCTGDPSAYDSCEGVNKDELGNEGVSDFAAALHPLSRYLGLLEGLEQEKQQFLASNEIIVAAIAGVSGVGEDWSVSYADVADSDPDYQLEYGIGPGCTGADGRRAVPPVRMRAVGEAFEPEAFYSFCDSDYAPAMADLGERITAQFGPACSTVCVADAERSTPQLEPSCVLEQDPPGPNNTEIMQVCERAADGSYLIDPATDNYQLPADADVCYVTLVDPDGTHTQDPHDDMSEACRAGHYNLEFVIVRREGVPAPPGTSVSPDCVRSDCPLDDCPGIGG